MPSPKNPQPPGFGVHRQDFGDLARRELAPIERTCDFCHAGPQVPCGSVNGDKPGNYLPYFHAARRHPRKA